MSANIGNCTDVTEFNWEIFWLVLILGASNIDNIGKGRNNRDDDNKGQVIMQDGTLGNRSGDCSQVDYTRYTTEFSPLALVQTIAGGNTSCDNERASDASQNSNQPSM